MYTLSLDKIFLNTRLYEEIKVHDLSVNTLLNLLFYYHNDDIFFLILPCIVIVNHVIKKFFFQVSPIRNIKNLFMNTNS
ncbi:hypothetical protein QW060_18925 [Myroides ceti]|uniref:Uncharacterized protein n=1 Tax=Paenimyroides ceti TaxID=395087 RepID=A0ABT8CY18_9FLAO|nr:hypothetical protein [Paenimyroides ceti]MDN3709124.1 hypothetical protein [Paenimyroides ceti]